MIVLNQIREKIIEAINASGLTQKEIGNKIGVKQQAIGQYLSGRAMPALDTFANLCEALDLEPREILCIHENGSKYINSFNNFNNSGSIEIK